MFSVIIPLYNKELSIKNTIQSVLDQVFEVFEIVIVNDGSTDNSLKIVNEFKDYRIKIIDKQNGGVSTARNKGIENAKYDWIAFLDGDDLWSKEYLENIYQLMQKHPDNKVFCSGYATLNNEGNIIKRFNLKDEVILDYFKKVNSLNRYIFHTSAVVVNKKKLKEVGCFNIMLTHGEDLDLWERLAMKNQIIVSSKINSFYRVEAENRSNLSIPPLSRMRIYNVDSDKLQSAAEKEYYKKGILQVLCFALRKGSIKKFFKMKKKHKSLVTYSDFINFLLIKCFQNKT